LNLSGQLDAHRAVIAAHDLGQDEGARKTRSQSLADQEVVDTPADVARPRVALCNLLVLVATWIFFQPNY
jgi:hypothetical protein